MYGSVKIEFLGICTLIPASFLPPEDPTAPRPDVPRSPHLQLRVVLVDASRGAFINNSALPPHEARLQIDPRSIVSVDSVPWGLESLQPGLWQLRGAALWIEDAEMPLGAPPSPSDGESLPSLTKCATPPGEVAAPKLDLDPVVVSRGGAAGYFDVTGGQIDTAMYGESMITTLFVETPSAAVLCVYSFANRTTTRMQLAPATKIILSNAGKFADAPNDFYLHYCVLTSIPPHITAPGGTTKQDLSALSAGCSNSNYP